MKNKKNTTLSIAAIWGDKMSVKKTIIPLFTALTLSGCMLNPIIYGNGVLKQETRVLPPFNSINTEGAFSIEINGQKEQNVQLTTDENLIPYINTSVNNNTLYIKPSTVNLSFVPKNSVKINISLKDLRGLNLSGLLDITGKDIISDNLAIESSGFTKINLSGKTKSISVNTSGSSGINLSDFEINSPEGSSRIELSGSGIVELGKINNSHLEVKTSGFGSLKGSGELKTFKFYSSGSGSISAPNLIADKAEVTLDGGGSAEIGVNTTLDANISGWGKIIYHGKPSVNQKISGPGTITGK